MDIFYKGLEEKWVKIWEEKKVFEPKKKDKKFFIIFAYPGPSGYLHVGHLRNYTYTDVIARYKRMRGYSVLFPVGVHATGNVAIGFAKKLQRGDKDTIEYLKAFGVDEETIEKLKDPYFVAEFFDKEYIKLYKMLGFSINEEYDTTTIRPEYQKFIEWQFKKLMEKGYLVKKPYYAWYCPNCGPVAVDPSETDISKGGNAEMIKFTIIKFKYKDYILPCATLRPETIFGVVNIWVNPNAEYVVIKYKGEKWIVSKECAEKLKYQKDIEITEEKFKGEDLLETAIHPLNNKEIPILPGEFVNPDIATGVVMSVPSHAPYDYVALKELNNEIAKKCLENMIPLIKTEGYSEFPAKEIVEKMNITSQKDPKLEEATQKIYKDEFHKGVLNENCGEFAGMKVHEAKEKIIEWLESKGIGDFMYESSEEVICRCKEKVYIKKIEDQWFIKYSDENIKKLAHEHAKKMTIIPEDYYKSIHQVIDWYDDRPCTRMGSWLGTKFPFDKKWVIEPIADSTIYPAFYIVAKYVNEGKIKPEQLTEKFFDYVFLGEGNPEEISKETGIDTELLKEIREEFDYWYPLDLNCGGKEHKTVHFPVFLMCHLMIFPEKYWPKGILVNGWLIGKGGGKISKSKGGAEPIPNVVEKYSADALRLYYCITSETWKDLEWDEDLVIKAKSLLEKIIKVIQELRDMEGNEDKYNDWILHKVNKIIKEATNYMENYDIRNATIKIYHEMYNSVVEWINRGGNNKEIAEYIIDVWLRMMSIITPFIAEELSGEKIISTEEWPKYDESKIKEEFEIVDKYLERVKEDIRYIINLTRKQPKRILIWTCEKWKYEVWKKCIEKEFKVGEIISELKEKYDPKVLSKIVIELCKHPDKNYVEIDEEAILENNKILLEKEFNCEIIINKEFPENKKDKALPMKPAIHIE